MMVTSLVSLTTFVAPYSSYAQLPEKVQNMPIENVAEPGCPVAVTNARAELDLDPFSAPIDARVYTTYKNVSNRPVQAVKFRIRLVDNTGKELRTFQAPDAGLINPGEDHSGKWKSEGIDPHTTAVQVRVLEVMYADNSVWQSFKMKELDEAGATPPSVGAAQPQAAPQNFAPINNAVPPAPGTPGFTPNVGAAPSQDSGALPSVTGADLPVPASNSGPASGGVITP
ncbi:MAG TPA: hypothetical protein V6C81_30725 [Planktothrix sp.]